MLQGDLALSFKVPNPVCPAMKAHAAEADAAVVVAAAVAYNYVNLHRPKHRRQVCIVW